MRPLIGKWVGTGEAPEGKGDYVRTYQFVLNNKFIELRNKSMYPATKEKPKRYVHEDYGYISYDKTQRHLSCASSIVKDLSITTFLRKSRQTAKP